jgi:hypothetical protein
MTRAKPLAWYKRRCKVIARRISSNADVAETFSDATKQWAAHVLWCPLNECGGGSARHPVRRDAWVMLTARLEAALEKRVRADQRVLGHVGNR